jgi:hypothetical protein
MNAIDLTTLSDVKTWMAGIQAPDNQNTDSVLQSAITAVSLDVLRRTGRGPRNWQVASQSPYNQQVEYMETYDGSSTARMFLRNFPIVSVSSLTVFGTTVSPSTSQSSPGFVIDGSAKSISLISPFSGYGYGNYYGNGRWPAFGLGVLARFPQGVQNVQVTYTAGFNSQAITNELRTVPALPASWAAQTAYSAGALIFGAGYVQAASIRSGAQSATSGSLTPSFSTSLGGTVSDGQIIWTNTGLPYTVTAAVQPWLSNTSITYFSGGAPLAQVFAAPAVGQYFIQYPGVYLFNVADAGTQILLAYTAAGTPPDVQLAATRMVYLTYKRRGWEGLRSMAQKDVGQTNYSAWEVDPEVREVLSNYTRSAITG